MKSNRSKHIVFTAIIEKSEDGWYAGFPIPQKKSCPVKDSFFFSVGRY